MTQRTPLIPDEVERELRFWGQAFGARPPAEDVEPGDASTIAQVAVDRTREADARRAEEARPLVHTRGAAVARRLIQQRLGDKVRVPPWAGGDPVRCTETRSGTPGWQPPPEAERIELLVLDLGRWDRRAAVTLRACYCLLGRRPLSERIHWAERALEQHLSRMNYRAALARGRIHVARALMPVEFGLKNTG